jgi:hypothetical protein
MRYQISQDVLFSKVDDEVILMSIEADSYFGLDPVGSRIWELLEEPATMDELVSQLTSEYEVEEAECREDAAIFIDDMVARGLIRALDAAV